MDMLRMDLEHALFGLTFKGIVKPYRNTNIRSGFVRSKIFVKGRLGIQQTVVQLRHRNVPIMFY